MLSQGFFISSRLCFLPRESQAAIILFARSSALIEPMLLTSRYVLSLRSPSGAELMFIGSRSHCMTSYGACEIIRVARGNIFRTVSENAEPKSKVQIWVRRVHS